MKRKNFRLKKRGSLNLSIEAIVIVVIAFTVLGLGLAFVKSQLGGIGKTSSEVQSKIKDQILEDMRSSGKKLAITQEIILERGKQAIENVGIVNTDVITRKYGIRIDPVKMQKPDGTTITDTVVMDGDISFFYNNLIEKELSPTSGDVIPLTISTKSSAAGNYLYKVTVFDDGKCANPDTTSCDSATAYDTRSFFVKVG
ncbi:MAG: hypothetical protein V2A62_02510 [Candidatus Woesearchaeota archaeon]